MVTGTVFDIKKFSIHDGPGIRTTVFLKGCPLRCQWCHNPESQDPKPEIMLRENRCILCGECIHLCQHNAITWQGNGIITDRALCVRCGECTDSCYAEARELIGRNMTVSEVMAEIERDISFYDESGGGVTFSGGEPLMQRDFLGPLLRACKQQEIHTAVDTCGYASWRAFSGILDDVDLFLFDLKVMDAAKHRAYTGVSNELILDNLKSLAAAGQNILIRMAIIPGMNDDMENIRSTAAFVSSLPKLKTISILPYHSTAKDKYGRLDRAYDIPHLQPPSEARMANIAEILAGFGLEVKIGG